MLQLLIWNVGRSIPRGQVVAFVLHNLVQIEPVFGLRPLVGHRLPCDLELLHSFTLHEYSAVSGGRLHPLFFKTYFLQVHVYFIRVSHTP